MTPPRAQCQRVDEHPPHPMIIGTRTTPGFSWQAPDLFTPESTFRWGMCHGLTHEQATLIQALQALRTTFTVEIIEDTGDTE
jgi:hypothetical protein